MSLAKPPYKSVNGIWYTQALFWEQQDPMPSRRPIEPVFSLYSDRPGLVNARKTFVALGDPTGYRWCMEYLGDWEHWKKLMKCPWFVKAFDAWNDELNIKLRSEAMDVIRAIANEEGNKSALPAARYLAELDKTAKRGRPGKAEITAEAKKLAEASQDQNDDMQRIGLKIINGGKDG